MSSSVLLEPIAPALSLAPFWTTRLSIAVPVPDAGLAVFDAILTHRRSAISMPAISAMPAEDWGARRLVNQLAERNARRCPSCGWADVRRSAAHNAADYLLSVVGLVPYRCRTCSDRFHRARQTAPSPGLSSVDVSIMPSLT